MSANSENWAVRGKLAQAGIECSLADAETLRRAERTLHGWAERECGTERGCITRDEDTDRPSWQNAMTGHMTPIADREAGALRRVAAVCERIEAHFFHQGDPRGCALYVSREPIAGNDYSRGVAICVD